MKVVLLDIEGTTTPIDFVHQTLFPFAKAKIEDFVRENFSHLKNEIVQLKTEFEQDFAEGKYLRDFDENSAENVASYLKFLIEVDRKSTPLKSLQGQIWEKGYQSGELKSEVFADVPPSFERWKSQGKTIAIYSSGSVLAQKLLFGNTTFGNLNPFISNYFDTNIGGKKETQSYQRISSSIGFPPVEILFVSDVLEELESAFAAGFQVALSLREGNFPINSEHSFQTVENFFELE